MSKRRLEIFPNLKKVFLGDRLGGLRDLREAREVKKEWIRSQLRDFSKLGGELVVMKMGS